MKLKALAGTALVVAGTLVAGPAFAQTATQTQTAIGQVGTDSLTNIGYAAAAIAVMAPGAIGLAYLSGTIRTAIGWGKTKK